jgi:hypothetical protein
MAQINEFISLIKTEGLARQSRFVVYITPPRGLSTPNAKLKFLCDSASLPGMNFLSNPVTSYGEQREVIYNRSFEPVTLEFMLDQDMAIKRYFDDWQALIIHPVSRVVNYYQNYVGTIEIHQLDNTGQEKSRYIARLHEAFPKSIAAISYNASAKDVSKLSVSIEYKYWTPLEVQRGANEGSQEISYNDFEVGGAGVGSGDRFAGRGLTGQNYLDVPSEGNEELSA